jgi:hypothetical protein
MLPDMIQYFCNIFEFSEGGEILFISRFFPDIASLSYYCLIRIQVGEDCYAARGMAKKKKPRQSAVFKSHVEKCDFCRKNPNGGGGCSFPLVRTPNMLVAAFRKSLVKENGLPETDPDANRIPEFLLDVRDCVREFVAGLLFDFLICCLGRYCNELARVGRRGRSGISFMHGKKPAK